jgi:20S proteasome alpha/beta subunit
MLHKTKQLNWRKSSSKLPNMTIILGVKCIDGIVLVGDRKLRDSNKTDFSYGDKITGEVKGFLTAFSGDKSVFDLFR